MPEWHTMEERDVLKELQSSPDGLSESEVRRRLRRFGPNELEKKGGIHPALLFASQFRNFLVIILLIASIFAFGIGEILDGSVILIIVILNAVFGFVQEYRANKAIEALKRLTSPETIVTRNGKKIKIPSSQLVPGDIVSLDEGTRVPAGLRLLDAINLKIDEASLTGESEPVTKRTGALKKAILAERKNMAFMGTTVTFGRGTGVVVSTGMKTEIGKIARLIQEAPDEETPLQHHLGMFSKNLGIIILGISLVVIIGGILRQYDAFDMILTGIALAVAAIPEGLPAVVTITLALGLQKLSKENALIRKLPAVETLGSTSVICADKTGTLTKNEMTVRKIWYGGKVITVSGEGYQPHGSFHFGGKPLKPDAQLSKILLAAGLCNNASLDGSRMVGDPTEGALLVAAAKAKINLDHKRVAENPFTSERKMMSTLNMVNGKQQLFAKGAPEILLDHCSHVMVNGKPVKLRKKDRDAILKATHDLSSEALRVLGIATGTGKREHNLVFLGLTGMIDPPREKVKHDIATCQKAGITVVMITGDHQNTAVAIAKEIGLYHKGHRTLTGEDLNDMDDLELRRVVEETTVYARVNPAHKARIVGALKKKRHVVAMTGDGVNDAPALKMADIGIAMGIKGTDVAKEASDMILADDDFSSIVSAVKSGRGVYDNITHFIRYLLSSNIAEVLIIFLALLIFFDPHQPLIPLLAVQILWVNLVTDGFPALALGVDPPAPEIMKRKPRSHKERLLNPGTVSFVLIVGVIITIGTLWIFATELPNGLQKAQTMAFTSLVMFEMFNVFNVRNLSRERVGFFTNKKLLLAIALSIFLQLLVIYYGPLQQAFGTVPLAPGDWIKIILVSVTVLLVLIIKKMRDLFISPKKH